MIKQEDIQFVSNILPDHYWVRISETEGAIYCSSPIGIRRGIYYEDEKHWDYIMQSLRIYFAKRLLEVYHNTCSYHVDFIIYLEA